MSRSKAGIGTITWKNGVTEFQVWVIPQALEIRGQGESEYLRAAAALLLAEADAREAAPFEAPPGCTMVDDKDGLQFRLETDGLWLSVAGKGPGLIGYSTFDRLVRSRGPVTPYVRSQRVGLPE